LTAREARPPARRPSPLPFALAALAVLAIALVAVLSSDARGTAGGNNEFDRSAAIQVPASTWGCQQAETVPRGTGAVRFRAQGSAAGTIQAEIRLEDRVLARGQRQWSGAGGDLDIPVRPEMAAETDRASVCLRPGADQVVTLWGYPREESINFVIDGRPTGLRARVGYLRPDGSSWAGAAGDVLDRIGTARGTLISGWAGYGAIALMLAAIAAVLVAIRRELAR
jgi:hypothetical protein